jgi:hypothetical protein
MLNLGGNGLPSLWSLLKHSPRMLLLAQNTQAADKVYHGYVDEAIYGYVSYLLLPTPQTLWDHPPVFGGDLFYLRYYPQTRFS